jgi:predicted nicotinamide N-methyase
VPVRNRVCASGLIVLEGTAYCWYRCSYRRVSSDERAKGTEFRFDDGHGKQVMLDLECIGTHAQHILRAESSIVWPGASNLCLVLQNSTTLLHNKTILELGAGPGLAGLFASYLGATRVVLTDHDPTYNGSLPLLHCNIERNRQTRPAGVSVQARCLPWGSAELVHQLIHDEEQQGFGTFDILLASDVVYYAEGLDELFVTVNAFLQRFVHAVFILANTRIRYVDWSDTKSRAQPVIVV